MTDTRTTEPKTLADRLMETTDPQFWTESFFKHRTAVEQNDPVAMRPWVANAIEVGRRDGQAHPGGHDDGEIQQAIIDAFTEAYTLSIVDSTHPSQERFLSAVEPAMKRLMAYVTGRPLVEPLPEPSALGAFDQDAPQ